MRQPTKIRKRTTCGAGVCSLASRRFLKVAAAKCVTRKPLLIESAPRPAGDPPMLAGAFEQARIVRGLDVTADPASRRPRPTKTSPSQFKAPRRHPSRAASL